MVSPIPNFHVQLYELQRMRARVGYTMLALERSRVAVEDGRASLANVDRTERAAWQMTPSR